MPSQAFRKASICSRFNFSASCTLVVNPQHAIRSRLILYWKLPSPSGSSCIGKDCHCTYLPHRATLLLCPPSVVRACVPKQMPVGALLMNLIPKFLNLALKLFAFVAFGLLAAYAQDAPKQETHGIAVANMDRSVKPGDNFYLYCNGEWIKRTEIPPDRAGIGVFTTLADLSDKRTAALIEEAAKSAGPRASKIADLYNSYMDEAGIEAKGLAPIQSHLKAIAAISNRKDLAAALGESLRADVDALNNTNFHTSHLFGLWVAPAFHDSDHYAPYLMQGGVQLPDRDYYLSSSEHMREIRTKYQAHVSAMLKLAGFTDTDARAERIVALEHAIAEKHLSLEANDDLHKANNTWKQSDFAANAPGLDSAEYFRGAGLSKQASFTVWQPTAFAGESALVASTPLDTWKDWLAYHLIEESGGVLPKAS